MNIILGASGQVGSQIVRELINNNAAVRAVVRNAGHTFDSKVEIRSADFFNADQLTKAMEGGTSVFLLTPENPASNDIIGGTRQIIENYKEAICSSGIKKIIGLSSIGAHLEGNTGNLIMSRMLERAFDDVDIKKIFIRPAYYFSNWLGFMETIEQYGVLPSFFPEDLEIEMVSPLDVAKFIAEQIVGDQTKGEKIIELVGPKKYSARSVAGIFSNLLNKEVTVQTIPKEKWKETLMSVGFTDNTATNLMTMTQRVVDKKTVPMNPERANKLPTTLEQYLQNQLNK